MKIRELREAAGLTQADVARHLGLDETTVAKWEAGVSYPRAACLPKLADLFSCTIDALYGRDGAKQPAS